MLDVGDVAGDQVINGDDLMPFGKQAIREVGTEKTGAAGNYADRFGGMVGQGKGEILMFFDPIGETIDFKKISFVIWPLSRKIRRGRCGSKCKRPNSATSYQCIPDPCTPNLRNW